MLGAASRCDASLGEVKRLVDDEKSTRNGAAKQTVDIVKMSGLRKAEAASEREEITAEDVGGVGWGCWGV